MADYVIHKADGSTVTVASGAVDNHSFYNPTGGGQNNGMGIQLVGQAAVNYGPAVAQNFLQLTENFASPVAPTDATSLTGQLWYNTSTHTMYVKSGTAVGGGLSNWTALGGGSGGNMVYPGSGIPTSTGSAWGSSYSSGAPIPATLGGTGMSSPGTSGNVLTSNGTGWVSAPQSGTGSAGVSSIVGSTGILPSTASAGAVTLSLGNITPTSVSSNSMTFTGTNSRINISSPGTGTSNPSAYTLVQTTTANTSTTLPFKPNGTGSGSNVLFANNSTATTDYSAVWYGINGSDAEIVTYKLAGGVASAPSPNLNIDIGVGGRVATFKSTGLELTNALAPAYGGTGLTTVGTNGQVLTSNGSAIVWQTPSAPALTANNYNITTQTMGGVKSYGSLPLTSATQPILASFTVPRTGVIQVVGNVAVACTTTSGLAFNGGYFMNIYLGSTATTGDPTVAAATWFGSLSGGILGGVIMNPYLPVSAGQKVSLSGAVLNTLNNPGTWQISDNVYSSTNASNANNFAYHYIS